MTPDRFMNLAFALTANLTMDEKACILEREFREWLETKPNLMTPEQIYEAATIIEFNIEKVANASGPELAITALLFLIGEACRLMTFEAFLVCMANALEEIDKFKTI